MSLSTQVIVMNNGRIQQIDSPKNIYSNPSNTFVATFIGDTPMNLIEATIYGNELMINEEIIQTPEKYESQLSNYKRVILGVRSEDIYLNSSKETVNLIVEYLINLVKRDKNLKEKLEYKKMLRYPVNIKLLLINLIMSI